MSDSSRIVVILLLVLGNAVFDTQGRSSPARLMRDLRVRIGVGARRSDGEPVESRVVRSARTPATAFSRTRIPSLLADESDAVWFSNEG